MRAIMMASRRPILVTVTMLLLAIGGIFATPASASAQAPATVQAVCTGAGSCWFSWGRMTAGDCTMDHAKWTLHRDGSAFFEGAIVSSDSNDAWLMWVNAVDSAGIVLGAIHHGGDPKFVRGTVKNEWHWWFDSGTFDPALFDRINSMRMTNHC